MFVVCFVHPSPQSIQDTWCRIGCTLHPTQSTPFRVDHHVLFLLAFLFHRITFLLSIRLNPKWSGFVGSVRQGSSTVHRSIHTCACACRTPFDWRTSALRAAKSKDVSRGVPERILLRLVQHWTKSTGSLGTERCVRARDRFAVPSDTSTIQDAR